MMTDTTVTSRVLGAAWPRHFNKPVAEAMYENIKQVGLPQWSEADQALAKAVQKELKVAERGLATKLGPSGPVADEQDGAAARMTSAMSRGTFRRSRCVIRRTFPTCRVTTGPMRSRWPRRSLTKE